MKKFKVGIQLFGVRDSMAEDFEGTLKALRDMGYEYVEFAGYYGHTSEEIKAILDKLGLKCVSVHQSLDFFDEDPKAACEYLKGFGTKYSIIPWYGKEKLAGTPEWDETLAKFKKYADILKENGLLMGYHNHDFEFTKFKGTYLHDYIFDNIDADKIFPEFDTCWVKYAGADPCERLLKFKGRVPIVHLKDFVCKKLAGGPAYDLIDKDGNPIGAGSREDNGFEFRPLGMGRQDFKSILEACEEAGSELVVVEQDKTYNGMTELEAARISRDYLKNNFGF